MNLRYRFDSAFLHRVKAVKTEKGEIANGNDIIPTTDITIVFEDGGTMDISCFHEGDSRKRKEIKAVLGDQEDKEE